MSEKEKPRTNPRAGSNDPELWDLELDWYFGDFEGLCGLQSVGTSGAGENALRKPTEEEKAERRQRIKNGFLLTMPGPPKADQHSVSAAQADAAAFQAMAHGVFARGRRIWRKVSAMPYGVQQLLRQSYEERLREAGIDCGRPPLRDDQVRAAHRCYRGQEYDVYCDLVIRELDPPPPERKPWKNPPAAGAQHQW